MSRIVWDKTGERFYETGVRMGVLYPMNNDGTYPNGVPWNGLTAITESPSGAEANPFYADDIKYLNIMSAEDFGFTIEAYTYPDEWAACDGSIEATEGVYLGQQARKTFGLCYRTVLGNDIKGVDYGYKLHLIYCAQASPSEKSYSSINESPEAIPLSWDCTTTPVNATGYKPTACITIVSTKVDATKLKALEDMLYGTEEAEAFLPLPDAVITALKTA